MRAVVFDRFGGPEVLELREVPDPPCGPDEVLVEVKACGINHLDLWIRKGLPGLEIQMPHILGSDVVGVVSRVGEAVTGVGAGERVLIDPTLSCGQCPQCRAGNDNLCRSHDVLGRRRQGGYAEKVAVPAANCFPYPDPLDWAAAAAVPLVFLTAWHMLVGRAALQAGEDCLVIGAGSGVGSAAIQIARMLGARVIATAGNERKLELARRLGASETVDHSREDIAQAVRALTAKKGVEVVFEHVGGAVFEKCVASLARGGRLVTCGATAGNRATVDLNLLFGRQLSLLGSWMGRRAEMAEVLGHIREGRLEPVVDSVLPLGEARRAHQRIEDRQQMGKVVLVP